MKVALISCSKLKQTFPCHAAKMYMPSELFSLSYEYARYTADRIFILSGKYGLLEENSPISPYNVTLADFTQEQRLEWGKSVLEDLAEKCDLKKDEFILLAGKDYYEPLRPALSTCHLPLRGMDFFKRTAFLKEQVQRLRESRQNAAPDSRLNKSCDTLHALFHSMIRYSASEINKIPFDNGIYVVFEKGEKYKQWDRIVRIGTHTSPGRLRSRLSDHFLRPNKDGSIFRKNIGKALLNQRNHPYLSVWNLNTSKSENKRYVDPPFQSLVEEKVSGYLKDNMTFTVVPVMDMRQRLRLEEGIIATLHQDEAFRPGKTWLGQFSPETEIQLSGLWLKQGLDAPCLTQEEMDLLAVLGGESGIPQPNADPILGRQDVIDSASNRLRSQNEDDSGQLVWDRMMAALSQAPDEAMTKRGLWFRAFCSDGDLHVGKAHDHLPSCKISMERIITRDDFFRVYHYYKSWKNNQSKIRAEITKQSNNSSYILALINKYNQVFPNHGPGERA